MKRCPKCQSIYTDDSLSFCLQDGSKLAAVSDASSSAEATLQMSAGRELPATEMLKPEDMPTVRIEPTPPTKEQQRARPTALDAANEETLVRPPKPRSNATVIVLSAVVAILLVALGGLITWIMLRDKGQARPGTTASNTAPTPANTSGAETEVRGVLDAWADSIRQRNIDEHMKFYADKLEVFYNSSNVGADKVRAARLDAFTRYRALDIKLSKVKLDVTDAGTRASATFDKTFDFRGDKNFSGSVQSMLTLVKTGGRWRITGERDLQTYYINK